MTDKSKFIFYRVSEHSVLDDGEVAEVGRCLFRSPYDAVADVLKKFRLAYGQYQKVGMKELSPYVKVNQSYKDNVSSLDAVFTIFWHPGIEEGEFHIFRLTPVVFIKPQEESISSFRNHLPDDRYATSVKNTGKGIEYVLNGDVFYLPIFMIMAIKNAHHPFWVDPESRKRSLSL